jgi:hypothetical protein
LNNDVDVRWKLRFQNFSRAISLLREAMELDPGGLSQLEKEGIIQRFEYTFELAWKVLKDRMQADGLILDQISPKWIVFGWLACCWTLMTVICLFRLTCFTTIPSRMLG